MQKNFFKVNRVFKLLTQAGISHPIKEVSVPRWDRHAQISSISKSDRQEVRGDFIFSEEPAPPCGVIQANSEGVPRDRFTLLTVSIASFPLQYGD